MAIEILNTAAAYEMGIDWSCYYTKAIIAPTLFEINKYYDFTWTQILILELLLREKRLHMSDERFFKDAEQILYNEFQYVLELNSKEDLMTYIFKRLDK